MISWAMATGHALEGTGKVPFSTKFYFGFGSISEGTKNTAFNVFLLFYYNQVLGLSGTLAGTAILLALVVDAVTDPLVGSFSDSFHSRLGRRHPFMYGAALPMAASFYLLFNPPAALEGSGLFVWLTVFAVLVRASMTLYAIPSAAMLPEITTHYDERTTLMSYRLAFGWFGGLCISLMGYQYFFAPSAEFADGRLDASAYGLFAGACAVVIFGSILVCAAGTHKLVPMLRPPPNRESFTLGRFFVELRNVFSNSSYRMLVMGALFASVAGGFNDVVGLYVNTYFWEFTTDQLSILLGGLVLALVISVTITRPLTERFDKKTGVVGLGFFAITLGPLPVFLRLLDWFPANGHPALLWIIFGHGMLIVTAVIAIVIIVGSMIADTVDENEVRTGLRQEGIFVSAIAFTTKATSGLGSFVAGVALDLIAFPRGAEPGTVDPDKIYALGLAVGPGLIVLYFFMLFFFTRYKMTREQHQEILAELDRRRLEAQTLDEAIDRAS